MSKEDWLLFGGLFLIIMLSALMFSMVAISPISP